MPSAPARNLEIKVLCPDLDDVRQRLATLNATTSASLRQTDTYFHTAQGRLKLRMIAEVASSGDIGPISQAELIGYQRTDHDGSRWSSYHLTPIAPDTANRLCTTLTATLGILVTVAKQREIAIVGPTRIHLDTVDGLGTFVELETMIRDQSDEAASAEHANIIATLGLDRWTSIPGSYSDLLRTVQSA